MTKPVDEQSKIVCTTLPGNSDVSPQEMKEIQDAEEKVEEVYWKISKEDNLSSDNTITISVQPEVLSQSNLSNSRSSKRQFPGAQTSLSAMINSACEIICLQVEQKEEWAAEALSVMWGKLHALLEQQFDEIELPWKEAPEDLEERKVWLKIVKGWLGEENHRIYLDTVSVLDLRFNDIRAIPSEIIYCTKLQQLYIAHNAITEIPEFFAQMTELRILSVHNNKISKIPSCLIEIKALRSLDLCYNEIAGIPQWFSQLKCLEYLNLSNNQISIIPACMSEMESLAEIDFACNQITEIPLFLSKMVYLEKINFACNQIFHEVPKNFFSQLKNLNYLNLTDNPNEEMAYMSLSLGGRIHPLAASINGIKYPYAFEIYDL